MANVARDVWTKAFAPTGQGLDQETWESMGRVRSLSSGSDSPRFNFGASLETQQHGCAKFLGDTHIHIISI